MSGPLVAGVDPKREGDDRFAVAWRQGPRLIKVESDARPIGALEAACPPTNGTSRPSPSSNRRPSRDRRRQRAGRSGRRDGRIAQSAARL